MPVTTHQLPSRVPAHGAHGGVERAKASNVEGATSFQRKGPQLHLAVLAARHKADGVAVQCSRVCLLAHTHSKRHPSHTSSKRHECSVHISHLMCLDSLHAVPALPSVDVPRRGARRHLHAVQRGQRHQCLQLHAWRVAKQTLLLGLGRDVPEVDVLIAGCDKRAVVQEGAGENLILRTTGQDNAAGSPDSSHA